MPDLPKLYYLVNDGTQLTAYRQADDADTAWFVIEARHCEGKTADEKAAAFADVVKFIRTAFGPLADYRELRVPTLPGMQV